MTKSVLMRPLKQDVLQNDPADTIEALLKDLYCEKADLSKAIQHLTSYHKIRMSRIRKFGHVSSPKAMAFIAKKRLKPA